MKSIALFILLILFTQSAFAVCLEGHLTVSEEFAKSENVIIGIAKSKVPINESVNFNEGDNYLVEIEEIYKGNLESAITILSENNSGRFPMEIGKSYILFIHQNQGVLQVDNCGNSGLVADSGSVINEIKKIKNEHNEFQVEADHMKEVIVGQEIHFSGNVIVKNNYFRITSDKVTLFNEKNNSKKIRTIQGSGDVEFQQSTKSHNVNHVLADSYEIQPHNHQIVFRGPKKMYINSKNYYGSVAIYNYKTNEITGSIY